MFSSRVNHNFPCLEVMSVNHAEVLEISRWFSDQLVHWHCGLFNQNCPLFAKMNKKNSRIAPSLLLKWRIYKMNLGWQRVSSTSPYYIVSYMLFREFGSPQFQDIYLLTPPAGGIPSSFPKKASMASVSKWNQQGLWGLRKLPWSFLPEDPTKFWVGWFFLGKDDIVHIMVRMKKCCSTVRWDNT